MNHRLTAIAMTGALMGTFVLAPIAAVVAGPTSKQEVKDDEKPQSQKLLANGLRQIPVTGSQSNGKAFQGFVSIDKFGYDQAKNQLLVTGVLIGTATKDDGTTSTVAQKLIDVPATMTSSSKGKQLKQLSTNILSLNISGPISLNLLGLTVNLSPLTLNIDAVTGPGNLLGNLLFAVVNLLNGGPLAQLLQLIDQINTLLSSF